MRKLILLFIVAMCVGCASSQPPSQVGNLSIKVTQLERKLKDKDEEIDQLKYSVSDLKAQINDLESDLVDGVGVEEVNRKSTSYSKPSADSTASGDDDIIRVSASPKDVQTALKNAGYYSAKIDGKIGSGTKKAISDFQKDNDLKPDGIIGKKTWALLKSFLE